MTDKFNYGEYFRGSTVLGELLRTEENPSWLTRIPSDPPKTKNLIYLGCNVFKTVHLVETLCKVLDYLEVDYKAVGGPAFCCGTVHRKKGDVKPAKNMYVRTVTVFDKFESENVVHWCPSCEEEFEFSAPLKPVMVRQVHFSEFLFNRLQGRTFPIVINRRLAFHYHGGEPRAENESEHALKILRMIPGLELVPLTAPDSFGTHCASQGAVRVLGIQGYQKAVQAQFDEVRKLDCEGIVSVYHSCHREFAKARRPGDGEVINYMTLVAQSLGLPIPEDRFQHLASLSSLDKAVEEVMPTAVKRGIDKNVVEAILKSQLTFS